MSPEGDAARDQRESDDDDGSRLDRELIELLNELRVVLPGIQVLFAFLLAVPFSQRFQDLTDGQQGVFFGAFITTSLASVFLLAPSVQHRLRWRQFDKERLLRASNRLTIAGTFLMAVAIDAVVYLVTDVLYGDVYPVVAAVVIGLAVLTVWWASPLLRSLRRPPRGPTEGHEGS
jgi:hypothetical protein